MLNNLVIASNPFFAAYFESDLLGKLIILILIALSIVSWVILVHKLWLTYQARKSAIEFQNAFLLHKLTPLSLDCDKMNPKEKLNPFRTIYTILKKNTLELLNKNRHFTREQGGRKGEVSYLSQTDIDYVEGHLYATITNQTKYLEKNLFILATIVSLGPFLGLLGTVWGILNTFSDMGNAAGAGGTHQAVLGGLSLALATTVLGLVDAIPALIGYNYLKNNIRDFNTEMDGFAHEILSSVEMQYRKVDLD